jgi:hypothetical protein
METVVKNPEIPWTIELWKGDNMRLFGMLGNNPVIFVICAAVQEVMTKMKAMSEKLGYRVIYINKDCKGLQKTLGNDLWICDPITAVNYLRMRSHRKNVIFFTIHSSVNWQSITHLKTVIPDAKIVSYVYDWQNLFVPEGKLEAWEEYTPNGAKYAQVEINIIKDAVAGKECDGIIHGDYGNDWPYLKHGNLPVGALWMPRCCSKDLYQPQPPEDIENRCVVIGTVLHKSMFDHKTILFQETHIERLYHKICNDGYKIDIFTLFPKQECVEFYAKEFPHKMVRLHQGMMLPSLLKTISKRFKFGLMLYEWDNDITISHDKVSMPTKFFTYLALGVPILISSRLEAAAKIVKENGCGIVFEPEDLNHIKDTIAKYSYKELLENVEKCRFNYCTESFQEGFNNFIKKAIELPLEKAVFNRKKQDGNHSGRSN